MIGEPQFSIVDKYALIKELGKGQSSQYIYIYIYIYIEYTRE